jgi:hypothetical protein
MEPYAASFQDLGYRYKFRSCRTPFGGEIRWMPYGMPRLRQEMLMTVFYLYGRNPRTGKIDGPCGTGVLVRRDASARVQPCPPHAYAVTAAHVVSAGGSIIRLNTFETKPTKLSHRFVEAVPLEWQTSPGGDDLAAIDVTELLQLRPIGSDFARAAGEKDFVTLEFANRVQLGPGDDAFMLGLFTGNPGVQYNLPAARFGNISQLADGKHPIEQGNGAVRPSHVFDMHSRPGFSGSPVFAYRTPDSDLTAIDEDGNFTLDLMRDDNAFLKLLGIHSGQFRDTIEAQKAEAYGQVPINDGDKLVLPSSMTVVVPAWKISELLDLPVFQEQRDMREKRVLNDDKPRVQPEVAEAGPGAANPTHKEDFKSLLTAASTKRPQDG